MSSAKKILSKLTNIESKLDQVLSRLDKLETRGSSSSKKNISAPSTNVKVGKVQITEYDAHILVTGDTFDIRNDFKVYRGKWDGDSKGWKIMRSNLNNYDDFKEELKSKCSKLQLSKGKNTKSTVTVDSHKSSEGGCMILDSSDSDSE